MKEADLFRQYVEEAMRRASSKSTNADERRALINLACRYSQAALMSERIVRLACCSTTASLNGLRHFGQASSIKRSKDRVGLL